MKSTRTKTDNAHLRSKEHLRRLATEGMDDIRVLDCFAGNNTLWRTFTLSRYYGIEAVKGKGANIHADNLKVIPSLDLSGFNVIDLDSYGSCVKQLLAVFSNPSLSLPARSSSSLRFTHLYPNCRPS